MRIAIIGGTGLVAMELIRQGLTIPEITSIISVARRPIQLEADAPNPSKFRSVTLRDYEEFTNTVKAEFFGADVCIWWIPLPRTQKQTISENISIILANCVNL